MRNRRAGTPPCTVVSAAAMKGKAASEISNGGVDDQCQQFACTRAGDRELRPLVADRGELHVQLGPQQLMAELHVLLALGGVGRGGRHDEAVGRRAARWCRRPARSRPRAASRRSGPGRRRGWRTCWCRGGRGRRRRRGPARRSCRAWRRRRSRRAERTALTSRLTRCEPVGFARLRILLRAQPGTGLDEHRALLLGPEVRRRTAGRAEVLAAVMAGECADRNRRVGRAEGGGACLGNRRGRSAPP